MRELERDHPEAAAPADGAPLPPLAVIGRGRAGGAIARSARDAGLAVAHAGRDDALEACHGAGVALIAVPDEAIGAVCATIAAAVPPLGHVGHVSGAQGLDVLAPAAERRARVFSLHPLQTLPSADSPLAGAPCAVAGADRPALELAERLGRALGMRPFRVPEEARAAYHAAACIASNFLVTLEEAAAGLLAAAGVENGRDLLAPLALRSAENWAAGGADALTGPAARGDTATIERHLEALARIAPELVPLYEALSARAAGLARVPAEAGR